VCEGVGPDADALTFSYLAEKLCKPKTAKMAAIKTTANFINLILRENIGISLRLPNF